MLTAKAGILDRIEQTFGIFIKNPLCLVAPLFTINFVMLTVVPLLFTTYLFTSNVGSLNNIIQSLYILFVVAITYGIIYMILIVPVTISTFKTSADIISGRNISLKDNISYGFTKLGKAFTLYWYMFAYAYLVPALCFIIAGLVMIYGLYMGDNTVRMIGGAMMGLAGVYALIQGIYRGLRSSFSIPASVLHEDYSKKQFQNTIKATRGKWWRIFGNFLLVGLIAGLSMGLITGLLGSISFLSADISDVIPGEEVGIQNLQDLFSDLGSFSFGAFIIDTISQILSTIVTVFIMIFSMILFMRLRDEAGQKSIPGKAPDIKVIDEL